MLWSDGSEKPYLFLQFTSWAVGFIAQHTATYLVDVVFSACRTLKGTLPGQSLRSFTLRLALFDSQSNRENACFIAEYVQCHICEHFPA